MLFWNVENLFDDKDDPGWFDDKMLLTNNPELYDLKIRHLQEILRPFAKRRAVMCFSEIENRAVLERLLQGLPNAGDYRIIYHDNDFARVKLGILSPIKVHSSEALDYARGQRPILRADLEWMGQRLILFVNHWKSRRGGAEKTEKKRIVAARFLYQEYRKIRKQDPESEVLIVGDFNDEAHDKSLRKGLHSTGKRNRIRKHPDELYNCLDDKKQVHAKEAGTIKHDGDWYLFDQALFSSGLLDGKGLVLESCRIYDAGGKLLYRNNPFRFGEKSRVDKKKRGYSDHLPIVTTIALSPKRDQTASRGSGQ